MLHEVVLPGFVGSILCFIGPRRYSPGEAP
jgi:hypothetical protein